MRLPLPELLAVACAASATVAGCGSQGGADPDAEISAVATTSQVADLVRAVGGERVEVHQLLAPGADPHDYEPRPSDVAAVVDAAAVFQSGGDVDEWLGDVVENAGGEARVVTLIESVQTLAGEGHGGVDPHWWQDPTNAIRAVEAIAAGLADADPEGARAYRRRAAAYVDRLEALDAGIERCIGRVPPPERMLVTTHASYAYFASRYGVEPVGELIPARSSDAQPSAGGIADLVDRIDATGVNAVFPQSPLNLSLEQAVAGETGTELGDPLWADSLGPRGSDGASYIEALAADTEAIVAGLTRGRASCRPGG